MNIGAEGILRRSEAHDGGTFCIPPECMDHKCVLIRIEHDGPSQVMMLEGPRITSWFILPDMFECTEGPW